jgi:hypothetical protein
MKHFIALVLVVVLFATVAGAVEDGQVMYAGGTAEGMKDGTIGKLDTKALDKLTFEGAGATIVIPYAKIDWFEYTHPVAHHFGVLPAIAVGMMKKRQRRHYFRFSYSDDAGQKRVAIFEVPKRMPLVLLAILKTKANGTCRETQNSFCEAMR